MSNNKASTMKLVCPWCNQRGDHEIITSDIRTIKFSCCYCGEYFYLPAANRPALVRNDTKTD